jgi:hypothetical protein
MNRDETLGFWPQSSSRSTAKQPGTIQLVTLQRLVELKRDAEDAALLKFWRHTAHAMLTIFAAKPAGPQSVN